MKRKKQIKMIFGVVLTIAIIYFAFKAMGGFDPELLLKAEINWGLAALSVALFGFSTFIRGLSYTLGIKPKIGVWDAWRIVAVGNAANMILPLRAGEGVRLTLIPHQFHAAERTRLLMEPAVADTACILLFSVAAIPFSGIQNPKILRILHIAVVVFAILILLAVIIIAVLPVLRRKAKRYMNRTALKMLLWVFLSWLIILASMWLGFAAFGYEWILSGRMALATFAATNLIMFIPSSPGGIGVFEYGVVLGLSELGVQEIPAKTIGLLLHIIQYAALLPLGIILYLTARKASKKRKEAGGGHNGKC